MNAAGLIAAGLARPAAAGILRGTRRSYRALGCQLASALLLYWVLLPPQTHLRADALLVLAGNYRDVAAALLPAGMDVVALPEANAPARVERTPDLGTALRRAPRTAVLVIAGDGLPARDRDAAAGLALQFLPAPERGLVELQFPGQVLVGQDWFITGRAVGGVRRLELFDPAGARIGGIVPDAQGYFRFAAVARGAGTARFELRTLAAASAAYDESVSVPVVARSGEPLAVILRAGAANAEFKYWRRWAADGGIALRSRASLSDGIFLRDGDTGLNAAVLAATDLVIIDERAWESLTGAEKTALQAAVGAGLGLLLRADGRPSDAVADEWRALGFEVTARQKAAPVTLDRWLGLADRTSFTAAPVRIDAPDAVPLLRADGGAILAGWRQAGRGRVGFWTLTDSYRLQLLGDGARYGTLWAQSLRALARPRPGPATEPPGLPVAAWVNERLALCHLGTGLGVAGAATAAPAVASPGAGDEAGVARAGSTGGAGGAEGEAATVAALLVDADGCAAYWPRVSGWHRLRSAAGEAEFFVRAANDGSRLRAARDRHATEELAAASGSGALPRDAAALPASAAPLAAPPTTAAPAPAQARRPLPRWPFLLAWLVVTGWLWWSERAGSGSTQGFDHRLA